MSSTNYKEKLIAKYDFSDNSDIAKDSSTFGNNGLAKGDTSPTVGTVAGRNAVTFTGGTSGSCYIELPSDLLKNVSDDTGLTISTWINLGKGHNVWERVFDFGRSDAGPYIFLTRGLRGSLFMPGAELIADCSKSVAMDQWMHVAFTIIGTESGKLSNAGPIIYVNGEVMADGSISQTSSGQYAKLRGFFDTFKSPKNYTKNYIGRSQFDVDVDFVGSLSDFRIYEAGLDERAVVDIMCEALTDVEILDLAKTKYLSFPTNIITEDMFLPSNLMDGKVSVSWTSSNPTIFDNGKVGAVDEATGVTVTAVLTINNVTTTKDYDITVLPNGISPYSLTINGNDEVVDISDVLYGLFYEDINNAADGGIYAELIMNRSFESFAFDTYDFRSGENGVSTGRNYTPLVGWSGDLDKMTPRTSGGLNEYFGITEPDVNEHYVTVNDGAVIFNKGFADTNQHCSIAVRNGQSYDFSIWAKSLNGGTIILQLMDRFCKPLSTVATVDVTAGDNWFKYGIDELATLDGTVDEMGQLVMIFKGDISIDMVSLMPQNVWGASEEERSATAKANFEGNPNYRLRRDLVERLLDLHPKFLRFPGGCISEGSYIWENVYDWKESVGPVETRKENFNVWGYMMTMGLGYMEYFQLAEDLNTTPLPVMACGVLCQARSDYANPAGGKLQQKYIDNFTDLIHFAISTDFENNEWAALRKEMGHETPFDLHYLGVGNENWGDEFFASFQIFKKAIDDFMTKNYPGYDLTILSTVGAQADDTAFQEGWKFLSGNRPGNATVAFTDGTTSEDVDVNWYEDQEDYMETIADEHYYRSNDYLLNNIDRYNYYYRNEDSAKTSKVFVGEYASNDKNTLAGAVAEAAIMTSFENNSDVVRLAAYAPLFNKVLTDSTYRWTPDCIWFDNETSWVTPNYYVQQMFSKYIGTKGLSTEFSTYDFGNTVDLIPHGGIEIATGEAEIHVKSIKVISNATNEVLIDEDFRTGLTESYNWQVIPGSSEYTIDSTEGLIIKGTSTTNFSGIYILDNTMTNYRVEVVANKVSGLDGFYIGVGVTDISPEFKNATEYAIAYSGNATGVKVYKNGIEGYTLGDYSVGSCAGNLRSSCYEVLELNKDYTITVDYGTATTKNLVCSYTDGTTTSNVLDYKLEAYNKDVFHSVTKDDNCVYIKLVNADTFAKTTDITIKDVDVNSKAQLITLTGDSKLRNIPNVNKRNNEVIVPVETTVEINNSAVTLELPSDSVSVLVLNIK